MAPLFIPVISRRRIPIMAGILAMWIILAGRPDADQAGPPGYPETATPATITKCTTPSRR